MKSQQNENQNQSQSQNENQNSRYFQELRLIGRRIIHGDPDLHATGVVYLNPDRHDSNQTDPDLQDSREVWRNRHRLANELVQLLKEEQQGYKDTVETEGGIVYRAHLTRAQFLAYRGQQVGTAQAMGEWMAIHMSDIGWSKMIGPSGESEILYEMALEDALHLGLVARR